jgi:LPS-assembly protein
LPITVPWGFLTAKAGYHYTHYNLSANATGLPDTTRSLPIVSVESGMEFDRAFQFAGTRLTQTLEPRLFYVYIPYRDQSQIPNFTTSETDFNFRQIFSENRFIGGDRINDANQLTAAISTRFVDETTGLERLRATVGQRRNFSDSLVTLSGPPKGERVSDLLALVSSQLTPSTWLDSTLQYSTNLSRSEQFAIGGRYSPEPGKIFNASYRYTRDTLEQLDFSSQWPVGAGWSGVARWNYSLKDRKLLEGLVGFEYNSGCWQVRAVAHRFITSSQQVSTSFQIQLELSGLSRIGINPLETLRQNIAGYKRSDELNP